mmetsp:Transcript_19899/g.52794  ORF Transcript_19899/g.52794 Transcript_19899/m.52794 type:complete len:372 (+) Transcript_19899:656-1771(+)
MVTVFAVPSTLGSKVSSSLRPSSSLIISAPDRTARSCSMALRWSPNPGALTAATCRPPRSLLTTIVASASPSTSSATITSGRCTLATCSSTGRMLCTEDIFLSKSRMSGSVKTHFCALVSVTKYGEMYPRSNFIPSTTSSSWSKVLPSATVMVPSLPTFSKASATMRPMTASPLAEIVATCWISSGFEMSVLRFSRSSITSFTEASIPRFRSIGFMPATTALVPSWKMARASTVEVVVPSPAMSLVFVATCLMSWAPTFTILSLNSMAFATVTPSLVTFGAPNDCSMTTFRPFGPSVTATASASRFAPASMPARAASPWRISFVAKAREAPGRRGARQARGAGRARMVDSMAALGGGGGSTKARGARSQRA